MNYKEMYDMSPLKVLSFSFVKINFTAFFLTDFFYSGNCVQSTGPLSATLQLLLTQTHTVSGTNFANFCILNDLIFNSIKCWFCFFFFKVTDHVRYILENIGINWEYLFLTISLYSD